MGKTSYVIALGSNRRHHRHGAPAQILVAARNTLAEHHIDILAESRIIRSDAMGPAGRAFANGALLIDTCKSPAALLQLLKAVEQAFGRRRGRRWGPRVLDLDLILWSEGIWVDTQLAIPHPGFRERRFVLDPIADIVPDWRDPLSGLTIRQIRGRFLRANPVDRWRPRA